MEGGRSSKYAHLCTLAKQQRKSAIIIPRLTCESFPLNLIWSIQEEGRIHGVSRSINVFLVASIQKQPSPEPNRVAIHKLDMTIPEKRTPFETWVIQSTPDDSNLQESTLSLPRSRSKFSQPFREKCISEVVRIDSIILFHRYKLWKAKFFILCDVIFLVKLHWEEIWNWSILGVKGLIEKGSGYREFELSRVKIYRESILVRVSEGSNYLD